MNVTTLRVALYQLPPWTIVDDPQVANITVRDSLMKDLMGYVKTSLNLSFTYLPLDITGTHGKPVKGQWTGVIGSIQRQEADVGMLPFWVTYERHLAIDFTPAFVYTFAAILSHAPVMARKDNFAYMKTLAPEVWVMSFASLVVLSALYHCSHVLLRKITIDDRRQFSRSFWDLFSAMWGQAITGEPAFRATAESSLLAIWWAFRVVVMTGFCGSLIASYAEIKLIRVDGLDDLAASPWLQPLTQRHTVFHFTIVESGLTSTQMVAERLVRGKGDLLVPQLFSATTMHAVSGGRAALLYDLIPIVSMVASHCTGKERFYLGREPVFWIPLAVGIRKGLPLDFRRKLDTTVAYYSATMQMERRLRAMRLQAMRCLWEYDPSQSQFSVLTLDDLAGVTYLFVIGIGCSLLAFAVERRPKCK